MNTLSRTFDNLLFTTIEDGPFFVDELFKQKFGDTTPTWGYSVVCFYKQSMTHYVPVCYTNFLPHEEVILVGGAMTNGRAFEFMPKSLSTEIRDAGGIYFHLLKYAFDRFSDKCLAYFGHAGDKRAYEVDINAGFEPTGHEHLIAHFHKPLCLSEKERLIAKIHSIGPF